MKFRNLKIEKGQKYKVEETYWQSGSSTQEEIFNIEVKQDSGGKNILWDTDRNQRFYMGINSSYDFNLI